VKSHVSCQYLFTIYIFFSCYFVLFISSFNLSLHILQIYLIVVVDGGKVALRGKKLEHGDGEVVIIGGMVLDIHATPSVRANSGTTVPGKVVIYLYFI